MRFSTAVVTAVVASAAGVRAFAPSSSTGTLRLDPSITQNNPSRSRYLTRCLPLVLVSLCRLEIICCQILRRCCHGIASLGLRLLGLHDI